MQTTTMDVLMIPKLLSEKEIKDLEAKILELGETGISSALRILNGVHSPRMNGVQLDGTTNNTWE